MSFLNATEEYYSLWLGKTGAAECTTPGVSFLYNPERNSIQPGYDRPFDLWIYRRGQRITVSFGERAGDRLAHLESRLHPDLSAGEILSLITMVYEKPARQSVKFAYLGQPIPDNTAKVLTYADYPAYLDFFRACHPFSPDPSGWLRDYFEEMAARRLCCGVLLDGLLLSCTDAPDMPYLPDRFQEIGIQTRNGFRKHGLATHACRHAIYEITAQKKCPLWSAAAENLASQHLAERLGFVRLAECFTLSL